MKYKAFTYHHTHWDAEWYFTEQEAQVQFVYHMKELFEALDNNLIDFYHLDGKTSEMEDYFKFCPDDKEKFTQYVKSGKIMLGPLYEQLSAFIAPGESIIKNLQFGMDQADEFGGGSKVAYIPDSFGQIQDYPKIFNGFGIKDFVFRRGMGDVHNLKNDFYWKSNDGSLLLTSVLQAGYSFAGLAFMQGRLIKNAGLNLDKKSILSQMKLCAEESTQNNDFLFPAGKDNCPVIFNFKDLIKKYNEESEDFEFVETTLEQYMEKLKNSDADFQVYEGEFYTTQYHRVHKSIFSARVDIKTIQDKAERLLIYEVQPLMTMLNTVGIPYEHGLVEDIWKILIRSQTHSEATNSDEVNEQILNRAKRALRYAESIKVYLTRKISASVEVKQNARALVICNPLPYKRTFSETLTLYTKNKNFKIIRDEKEISYSIVSQKKVYGGWKRKVRELLDSDRDYYETVITIEFNEFKGTSYETLSIIENEKSSLAELANENNTYIENDGIRIELFDGKISIRNKKNGDFIEDAIYFEDTGDQGDTFDYDYPSKDFKILKSFEGCKVKNSYETSVISKMTVTGVIEVPKDLDSRARKINDVEVPYELTIELNKSNSMISIKGIIKNKAYNHRMRLVLRTKISSKYSTAGTQFGFINRPTTLPELLDWKEKNWLEEPHPLEVLLNHVSLIGNKQTYTVFTNSGKEYEIIGDEKDKIALTLFRSVGHFGLPDLNRRPGRASGIPEEIMEGPLSQMIDQSIEFEYGIKFYDNFNANVIQRDYMEFALTPIYFETQEFNRVFVPMKYFEINKLTFKIPTEFSLLELIRSEAIFSGLEKSKKDNAYILRIYNNENKEIKGGEMDIQFNYKKIEIVNLREEYIDCADEKITNLKAGEIRTYKIYF